MSAASCFFRLCRQRQFQSTLKAGARQTVRKSGNYQTRKFGSFRTLYAEPEIAERSESSPDLPPFSTVVSQATRATPSNPASIPGKSIFCRNLAHDVEQDSILQAFSKYGTVTGIKRPLITDKNTRGVGHNKGSCFIDFASVEEAAAALKALDGTKIAGRRISLQFTRPWNPQTTSYIMAQPLSARDLEYVSKQPLVTGTVSRVGTMAKTVSVTTNRRYLDSYTKTHHVQSESVLVHDPENILAEGDVIKYQHFPPDLYDDRAALGSKNVKFTYKEMVTPFGMAVEERTPRATKTVALAGEGGSLRKQK